MVGSTISSGDPPLHCRLPAPHSIIPAGRAPARLLIALAGRARLLECKAQRKKYRAKAELPEAKFETALRRLVHRAVAALALPKKPPVPKPRKKNTYVAPRQNLTPWKREADGTMTRTLLAVDAETAKANGRRQAEPY